jgi:hypothetical protein
MHPQAATIKGVVRFRVPFYFINLWLINILDIHATTSPARGALSRSAVNSTQLRDFQLLPSSHWRLWSLCFCFSVALYFFNSIRLRLTCLVTW